MDLYLTAGLVVLGIAILVLLILLLLRGQKNGGSEERERLLRTEITDSVQKNMQNLGSMLTDTQKAGSEMTAQQLRQLEERLKTLEANNEAKLDSMRKTIDERLTTIREENTRELDKIRGTVDEKLQKTLDEKLAQSFKQVSEHLESVQKGIGEMQSIAAGVGDIKKVLSKVKTRGILGEIQLGAILSEILAPEQYAENVAVIPHSANRVEYAVKLPGEDGDPVWLPIDSKFPGDTYAALHDAYENGDPAVIDGAVAALMNTLKSEAKDIHDKYIEPPYTTNFAILFLPFEGLYAEAVNRGMVELLQRQYNVNVAGPSTMAALLNSLQMGFRTLAIQKRSAEVWKILGAVKTEFGKFSDTLSKTQNHLRQAQEDLDALAGTRTNKINLRLREVESLDAASADALLGDGGEE